jgi:hypothetical protein
MGCMTNQNRPIGPFRVDDNGLLRPASASSFPAFRVRWRTRMVHTRMLPANGCEDKGHLEFTSRLGRIPSTAERGRPARGDQALVMLRHLPALLPQGWSMELSPDHSVLVASTTPIQLPISAVALVSKVTLFLLTLAPYLDVLDAEGVTFAAGGTVNTWPG